MGELAGISAGQPSNVTSTPAAGKDLGHKGKEKTQIMGYQRLIKDGQWEMGKFLGSPAFDTTNVVQKQENKKEALRKKGLLPQVGAEPTTLEEAVEQEKEADDDQVLFTFEKLLYSRENLRAIASRALKVAFCSWRVGDAWGHVAGS